MLIRPSAILLLALAVIIALVPGIPQHAITQGSIVSGVQSNLPDPSGSVYAFNYSYSQANLYTNASASPAQILPAGFPASNLSGIKLSWLNTVNRTSNNSPIANTGFEFNTTKSNLVQGKLLYNWTLTVPQFNCVGCTGVSVEFNFFGSLTKGTNATYTLYPRSPPNSTVIGSHSYTATGAFPTGITIGCPENVCIDVTKYRGYNVTLSFSFGWNSTEASGMFAQAGEITVAAIGSVFPSASHLMVQDPTDSSRVIHTAQLSSLHYNNTLVTYVQPGNVSTTKLWWHIEVINFYYPVGYTIKQITLNSTTVSPSPPEVPFENEHCALGTGCSESLLALNVTDFSKTLKNSNVTITANSLNSIRQLSTLSGGVSTRFFTSGDQISVKVVNSPSIVNASTTLQTGSLTITFQTGLSIPQDIVTTATGGVYNFTLPANCGINNSLCAKTWSISAVFASQYDIGNATTSFRIDLLQVTSFSSTGGSNSLSVQGTLQYGNTTGASGVNATLVAVSYGTSANQPMTNKQNTPSTSRLYISNITLVNGAFTQGQSLIILFTVINPNATQAFNATLTIQHEWPGPQAHNVSTTFTLRPGDALSDLPFNSTRPQTYEASILFTGSGVQVTLKNLRTAPNSIIQVMTPGTSPVLPNRPHAGLFNLILASVIKNNTLVSPSTIASSTYAYIPTNLAPAELLYASPVFQTGSNGAFTQTVSTSSALLGAKNLTVFVLARDAFGIVVVTNSLQNSGFTDSTALVSTADSIGPVAKSATATATLHLKSNSSLTNGITELLTVNLFLSGNGLTSQTPVASQSQVKISPGQTSTVTLTFTAPANVGSYTLTYSSPEYGGVLTSQTLTVTILSSNLQLLIPAGIGVVAAIIILGLYLVRSKKPGEEAEEPARPKGPTPKPKPSASPSTPAKSLTQTGRLLPDRHC